MTERQKAYRKFLNSEVWKALSLKKRELVGKCELCPATTRLQCHHVEYPEKWEETTFDQLQVLCWKCHRKEHGFWVLEDVDQKRKELERMDGLPTRQDEIDLVGLAHDEEGQKTVEAFFRFVASGRIRKAQWDSWLTNEARWRLWPWARRKFIRLKGRSYVG